MLVDVYCYVCGSYITPKDVSYNRLNSEYKKTYFCSSNCKKKYKNNHILCRFLPHINANQKRIDESIYG